MTNKQLSTAAQSVLKACDGAVERLPLISKRPQQFSIALIAAALKAAADQVVPEDYNPPRTAFCPEAGAFVDGKECRNEAVRYQLLAIAAELGGYNG
jgi:hypothetical protein